MADEITVSAALKGLRSDWSKGLDKIGLQFDMTGTKYQDGVQTVGITEEALDLGDVGTPGYVLLINLDTTNFVSIRPATGAANTIRLDPNFGLALFKLGSGATAPFAIADTAACRVQYLLLEA